MNVNQNEMQQLKTLFTGPSFSISQDWLNHQLRASASILYNTLFTNGQNTGSTITTRINGNYLITKNHSFTMSFIILRRQTTTASTQSFTECTLTAGYGYTF